MCLVLQSQKIALKRTWSPGGQNYKNKAFDEQILLEEGIKNTVSSRCSQNKQHGFAFNRVREVEIRISVGVSLREFTASCIWRGRTRSTFGEL